MGSANYESPCIYDNMIVAHTGAVHFVLHRFGFSALHIWNMLPSHLMDSASREFVLILQVLDLIDCSTYYLFIEQHLSSQLLLSSSV